MPRRPSRLTGSSVMALVPSRAIPAVPSGEVLGFSAERQPPSAWQIWAFFVHGCLGFDLWPLRFSSLLAGGPAPRAAHDAQETWRCAEAKTSGLSDIRGLIVGPADTTLATLA